MNEMLIGKGQNGSCYLEEDRVAKIYKSDLIASEMEDNIKKLSKCYSDSFAFPLELIYENNSFIGYYMKYINGVNISKLDQDILINDYIENLKNLEYEIASLSLQKIYLVDIGITNTMCTPEGRLYFVDTDFYRINSSTKNIYSKNISKFSYPAIFPYLDIYDTKFIIAELNYYLKLVKQGKILPSKFLLVVKSYLEKIRNNNIDNLSDFKKTLKLVANIN